MKVHQIAKGQIYLLPNIYNNIVNGGVAKLHNYIVVYCEPKNKFGKVQVMEITSLQNKEIIHEVPIILKNGYISYVIPYNMHSVSKFEIENDGVFMGSITDQPDMSTQDFIKLLFDLYVAVNDFGDEAQYQRTIRSYKKYTTNFEMTYEHVETYASTKPNKQKHHRDVSYRGCVIEESTKKTTKFDKKGVTTKTTKKTRYSSYHKNLEKFIDFDNIEDDVISDTKVVEADSDDVIHIKKIRNISDVTDTDKRFIMNFSDLPFHIYDWSNYQLEMFYNANERYSAAIIYELCNKFSSTSAVYSYKMRVIQEMKKRNLKCING